MQKEKKQAHAQSVDMCKGLEGCCNFLNLPAPICMS